MAKDLPQFQEGVALQPAPLPDVQSAGALLASRLTKFATVATGVVEKVQKDELNAQKMAGQVQIRDSFNNLRENTLNPKTFDDGALNRYDAAAKGIANGILANSPEKLRPALANFISYYGDRNRNVIATRVNTLAHNQLQAGAYEYVDKTVNDATNANYANETLPLKDGTIVSKGDILLGQLNNHFDTFIKTGVFTPAEVERMRTSAFNKIELSKYLTQFKNSVIQQKGDPNKWLENFNKNKSVPGQIKALVNTKALGLLKQVQSAQKAQQRVIREDAKDVILKVQNGALDANAPAVQVLQNRLQILPPDEADILNGKISMAQHLAAAKQAMRGINPLARQDIIDQYTPKKGDPDFIFKNKMISSLHTMSNELGKEFRNDRFAYVMQNPQIAHAFENRMTAANDGTKKIQPNTATSVNPFDIAIQKEKELGAVDIPQVKGQPETSVISNAQASAIVAQLNAFPNTVEGVKQKAQFLDDVYDMYGKYSAIANRDLARAGAPQNLLDLAGLEQIDGSKEHLQTIYNAISQPNAIKAQLKTNDEPGKEWKDFKQEASTALAPLLDTIGNDTHSVRFKNNMVNLVALASANYSLENNTEAKDAAPIMANAIYINRYSAILNGARIRKDISESNAKAAMFAMQQEISKTKFAPLSRIDSGVALTSPEKAQEDMNIIKTGSWRTIRGDKGLFWVDGHGYTVYHAGTKKRYEIHWDDLKDKTSDLNALIAKHPRTTISRIGAALRASPTLSAAALVATRGRL